MKKQSLTAGEVAGCLTAKKVEPLVQYVFAPETKPGLSDEELAHGQKAACGSSTGARAEDSAEGIPEKGLYTTSDWKRECELDDAPAYRSHARRDYARLLHCPAFRRLQGKTQLFPSVEHDFFRNRLTHSLEVAQIAKSIALRLNDSNDYFRKKSKIDLDLVETAALAHDLGHPPFGHNGEKALDDCMKGSGGFEGNAQSLHILARLEKKEWPSNVGLNLTHRTLAATLKYDKCIPIVRKAGDPLVKGYYHSEQDLVEKIKQSVLGTNAKVRRFRTIECEIMDLADDIAYSTYDLEDALKTNFVTPTKMIMEVLDDHIVTQVKDSLRRDGWENVDRMTLIQHMLDIWMEPAFDPEPVGIGIKRLDIQKVEHAMLLAVALEYKAQQLSEEGVARTKLTSQWVNEYVEATCAIVDPEFPALSSVHLDDYLKRRIAIIKHLTYALVIQSPRLKMVEYRGYGIVKEIFGALSESGGDKLLPEDYRSRVVAAKDELERARAICDFIAGMTDRYAIEFYERLHSASAQTIFKPL